MAHKYTFDVKLPDPSDKVNCLGNISESTTEINDVSLNNIKDAYFETFSVNFDTRNFTDKNNSEYLDIIPIRNEEYEQIEQVHRDDTNYVVEIFFIPNKNVNKYWLLDSIELQDLTLRDNAGIGTNHGIESSGTPLRPFVSEDKLELSKDQLRDREAQ